MPVMVAAALGLAAPGRAATYQTFVLSNEGGNGLVSRLATAGYGPLSLYEALVQIQLDTAPTASGIITPAFVSSLASAPVSSAIFAATLSSAQTAGQATAISTDGTVQLVNIYGST